ncbi:MAG TPA: outer membrane protein assembly factor BamD [Pyrinomonadaceae bacterium]|nr:outer membrane protein assembly factor BamD [Pyrinomonadaceae bacterium]
MRLRKFLLVVGACALLLSGLPAAGASAEQQQQTQQPVRSQTEGTASQRLEVLRQRLETMRRTLNAAIAGLNAGEDDKKKDKDKKAAADDPASRLRGLEKEAGSLLNEVNELRAKADRAEKVEATDIDKLESALNDLNTRADTALLATAGARRDAAVASSGSANKNKKKPGFFGRLLGRDGEEEYAELIGGVAPGRDRELFEVAAKEARKNRYEQARLLFNVIITTYPDSPYLPHAKLAIADTFYLEGTTSALIQAANSYREWQTFFPTDPLADEVLLKVAEVEMRQMGLPDRDVAHARKAEQLLKALLQQYPNTALRPDAQIRLSEVQENLGMHTFQVGNFYMDRYERGVAPNPKGAQSRYREVVEKYPNFSRRDRALYLLANTYVLEEEPDEAAKYFQELVRNFPNSEYAEKAAEQLEAIGAPKPEADPKAKDRLPPAKRSMTSRLMQQMFGTTPVTVDKNGVLISKDSDESSLIDVIIDNKGTLPVTTPNAPTINRRVSAVRPAPQTQPAPTATPQPADKSTNGLKMTPTNPGPPTTVDTPSAPPAQRPPTN